MINSKIKLSEEQQIASDKISEWLTTDKKRLTLGGLAGTGKTTLISHLLKTLNVKDVAICAFTGKAASVLRAKGISKAKTIHSLIYIPEFLCKVCDKKIPIEDKNQCPLCGKKQIKTLWTKDPQIKNDLIIVDESSMISLDLFEDLESVGNKILYVGDHGQLEPIGQNPNLMKSPDIVLEKIHRQAEGSNIIQFAHFVRKNKSPIHWNGQSSNDVKIFNNRPQGRVLSQFDTVICGYNKTRVAVNKSIRNHRGHKDTLPEINERVVCLRNNKTLGIFNGQLFTVKNRQGDFCPTFDLIDDNGYIYLSIPMVEEQFNNEEKIEWCPRDVGLFDFGYCLTTHKSQGSEWNKVCVLEQISKYWNPARWRYTAATRASQYLEYFVN